MRIAAIQSVIVCCMVGMFATGASAQDPTFSLLVGAVNGDPLPEPVSSIEAEPGDILRVWILLRDWSAPADEVLRAYQATIDYDGYLSGCAGNVYPVDFEETTDPTGACPEGGPEGVPNPNPFIDSSHEDPDFVFAGAGPVVAAMDTLTCDYRYLAAVLFPNDAPHSEPGVSYYCGTLDLEVSVDAAGVFTVGFDEEGTTIGEIEPLVLEWVTIRVPGAEPSPVSTYPPDGAIDARQPSDRDCTEFYGWDTIDITFDCDASEVQASDFTVTVDPPDVPAPNIVAVDQDGTTATLSFDMTIPTGHWTVVTHNPTGWSTRVGYLPADVNSSRMSNSADVLALIDFLNEVISLPEWSTDSNRSGASNPADILTVIDLLNGAGCLDRWNGETLPE